MARIGSGMGKDDAPGGRGDLAPELAVDEIADAAEKESRRNERRDEVGNVDEALLSGPAEIEEGQGQADGSAVEGHAAVPETQDFRRISQIDGQIVEDDVAQSAAQHAAQHGEGHKIIHIPWLPAEAGGPLSAQEPAEQEAHHVHETVPADRKAADCKGDRIK